jgi:acyl dehydratase
MTEWHRTHGDDAGLYLDDLQIGQRFKSGTYAIEEAQIKAFAPEFDPQPFHLDEKSCSAQHLQKIGGERLAHSWNRYEASRRWWSAICARDRWSGRRDRLAQADPRRRHFARWE